MNSQGADHGSQYRSVIYYHSVQQKQIAETVFGTLKDYYSDPIVTELSAATEFFDAEDDHQDYYNNNGQAGYFRAVIDPKILKLRAMYGSKLK